MSPAELAYERDYPRMEAAQSVREIGGNWWLFETFRDSTTFKLWRIMIITTIRTRKAVRRVWASEHAVSNPACQAACAMQVAQSLYDRDFPPVQAAQSVRETGGNWGTLYIRNKRSVQCKAASKKPPKKSSKTWWGTQLTIQRSVRCVISAGSASWQLWIQ